MVVPSVLGRGGDSVTLIYNSLSVCVVCSVHTVAIGCVLKGQRSGGVKVELLINAKWHLPHICILREGPLRLYCIFKYTVYKCKQVDSYLVTFM